MSPFSRDHAHEHVLIFLYTKNVQVHTHEYVLIGPYSWVCAHFSYLMNKNEDGLTRKSEYLQKCEAGLGQTHSYFSVLRVISQDIRFQMSYSYE